MNRNTEQKNTQGTPRFNIADVVILIVIVAIIAALGLRIYNIFGAEEELCRVEATFRVEGVAEEHFSLAKDAKLYSAETNEEVGYIKDFKISDYTELAVNENGELVEAKVPGKKTVTGTIILSCEKTDKGFYLDGTRLLTVGEKIKLYTSTREMMFELNSIKEFSLQTSGSAAAAAQAAAE
ncbi:MAG: DUF4330 family protein [Clostridia bacterium]|nr:DUF4330 family protein [Clostridia bacterium]